MAEVKLILPMPPSTNHMYVSVGRHRKILSKEYNTFKARVKDIWEEQGSPKLKGRLEFSMALYFDSKRRCDLDNRVKALFDSLNGYLYDDDSQIDVLFIKRAGFNKQAACVVVVKEIT